MLYGFVVGIGMLVGLEIPLVMRILRERLGFQGPGVAVLTFDYLGALGVSIAFPLCSRRGSGSSAPRSSSGS